MSKRESKPRATAAPNPTLRRRSERLRDLAIETHLDARRATEDSALYGLARILDAAWLAQSRYERGALESDALKGLERAADALLATKGPNEDWGSAILPKRGGPRRAAALRKLVVKAAEARSMLQGKRGKDYHGLLSVVASVLIGLAQTLGLAADRADRQSWLAQQLAERRWADEHEIARLTLEACGVEKKRAHNWINAILV